ncbi:MAG: tetratricopeptide repeat protein [Candidatus Eisenbacteria bacterium]
MSPRFDEAKELHRAGDIEGAIALYQVVVAHDPDHFRALNNLGACHEELDQNAQAEEAFRRALALAPAEAPLHHNLGRLMHLEGRLEEAEQYYRRAIELDPQLSGAHFNLGRLLQESGRHEDAEPALRTAVEEDPRAPAPHSCLGDALFAQRRVEEALTAYRRVAELDPADAATQFDLGKSLETLHRADEAVDCYRAALERDAGSDPAREALARALEATGRHDEAIASLRQWLEREPGHEVAEHLLASLGASETPDRASNGYVRDTFDRFAVDFDRTLARLQYQAPQLVIAMVAVSLGSPPQALDVLDAGCGTGLCGRLLKPYARHLVGVDLSGGMLERARRGDVYDELEQAELTAYLSSHPNAFDVIASADTFCYLGGLEVPFVTARRALRPGGLFALTLEWNPHGDGHVLQPNGRYAHSEPYVRHALAVAGFEDAVIAHGALRTEGGAAVAGLLVSARRPNV